MAVRRKAQASLPLEPEAAGGTCEVCGEANVPQLIKRHGGHGLACCFTCLNMSAGELAVAYGRRLRRAVER